MNLQSLIIESINQSANNVFSTMLGVELGPGSPSIEQSTPDNNDGVMSFIGVAGAWAGTGSVSCSPTLACRICALMLMTEATSVNEEVLDAVAELTNMIVGNVKTELEREVGPLGLSIPTVVFGRNFRTKSAGTTEWMVLRFPWEGEVLMVKLCLAPNEKTAHVLPHTQGNVCAVDV
jgi:chemotaxis protein CheX